MRMILMGLLSLLMAGAAQSADIALRPDNPYRDPALALVDLPGGYHDAAGAMDLSNPPTDLAALGEKWGWAFEGGLSMDGSHTFATLNMPAALGSLRAGRVVSMTGPITSGDAAALSTLIDEAGLSNCLSPGYCPFANVVSLDSPGGNFAEALRIADIIRSSNMVTVVGEGARCESACALIFLAGHTDYEGFFFPRRFAHADARIAVHQPSLQLPERDYSSDEVGRIMSVLSQTTNRLTGFFLRSGVSLTLLDRMYATPPEELYALSPLEMAENRIHVLSRAAGGFEATRDSVLAFCGGMNQSRHGTANPALVHNLQTDERSFVTFVTGQNFVCTGVRGSDDTWRLHLCDGARPDCGLARFGQAQFYGLGYSGRYAAQMEEIATYIDNGELGATFRDFAHRGALLAYLRLFAATEEWHFDVIPAAAGQAAMPEGYCGMLDDAHPALVRIVQERLNDIGIDVGTPDGSPGPKTRAGIRAAQARLLGDEGGDGDASGRISHALLARLGVDADLQARFTLCDPAYEG